MPLGHDRLQQRNRNCRGELARQNRAAQQQSECQSWLPHHGKARNRQSERAADAAGSCAAFTVGVTYVVHGSRQTGIRTSTGIPFAPQSDLDLGVVDGPSELVKVTRNESWKNIPGVEHGQMPIEASERSTRVLSSLGQPTARPEPV